jgi:CheY-like chemotaxis protein
MQKTILIVDFEQESSEELQQILQSEGFLVLTAADGHQALAVFEAAKPDLVLTEALLPKLNGFELCKKITNGELREVRPVIMYSAIYKGEKYQKEAVSGCGALEFLDKPIPKWQLLKAVRSAFKEGPLVKTDTAANLPGEAGVSSSSASGPIHSVHDAGDPLEVDSLFDGSPPVAPGPAVGPAAETVVLEAPLAGSKPSLMPSIDSQEVDAALDSVRMDLHQEAQQRDELLALQLEQELQQEGHSILEFEAAGAGGPGATGAADGESGNRELELDELLPPIALESPASSAETTAESIGTAAPSFAIKPDSSRNWLPVLILVLLALLAAAYFWFWG